MGKHIRLGIGLPLIDRHVDRDFFLSFQNMEIPEDTALMVPAGEIYSFKENIAVARNSLVAQARAEGCTHLLMMDTDQIHPMNTAVQLLSHDVDAVGALVCRRYPPFYPILYRGELGNYQYAPKEEIRSGELVEVDATGTGCILFNMDVFEDVTSPWFELKPGANGKSVGEDIRFCSRLREAGRRIFVDTSIHVIHQTVYGVNLDTHELWMKAEMARAAKKNQSHEGEPQ